jgi:hypothetical protein
VSHKNKKTRLIEIKRVEPFPLGKRHKPNTQNNGALEKEFVDKYGRRDRQKDKSPGGTDQ